MINIIHKIGVAAGRTGLVVQKHAPDILVGAGVAGVVTSGIFCCKATLKVDELLEEQRESISNIKAVRSGEIELSGDTEYTDKDYKRDMTVVYSQSALKLAKLYGPYITLGAVSIASILCGYKILNKRNLALAAAYKAVEEGFSKYRKRVISEFGEEVDRNLRYGIKKEDIEVTETDEEGNEKTKKVKNAQLIEDLGYSEYAKFFDAASPDWEKNPDHNLFFLRAQQQYANDLLNSRGHVFLNEVYDMLGIPRTQAGAVVGWVKGNGDDYVDFGIYEGYSQANRNFVNGYEPVILLDFNVDGVIWDKI